jgi:hypothetical protein
MPDSQVSFPADASSQISQQSLDVEVIRVTPGVEPQKLDFWLAPFHGKKQRVPAKRNCLLYAYYASVTDYATTPFRLNPEMTAKLQILKKWVYTLMMSNLIGVVMSSSAWWVQ